MKRTILTTLLLLTLSLAAFGESPLYPNPANWSFGDLADWAMPKIKLATDTLPPIASATLGDIVILTNPSDNSMGANQWQLWMAAPPDGSNLATWSWSMIYQPSAGASMTEHINATGTAVHGLGSMSTEPKTNYVASSTFTDHTGNASNPHNVTFSQAGAEQAGAVAAHAAVQAAHGCDEIASSAAIPANGSFTFKLLSDAPDYMGKHGQLLTVNEAENGLEWTQPDVGISTHSALSGLSYGLARHTGFMSRYDSYPSMTEAGWEDAGKNWTESNIVDFMDDGLDQNGIYACEEGVWDIIHVRGQRLVAVPRELNYARVLVSDDAGATWEARNSSALAQISARYPNTITNLGDGKLLVGFWVDSATATQTNRFARSSDYGDTWEEIPDGLPADQDVSALEYIGNNGVLAIAGAENNVWWAADFGETWVQIASITGMSRTNDHLFGSGTLGLERHISYLGNDVVLIAADQGEVWRSADRGFTWSQVSVPSLSIDDSTTKSAKITQAQGITFLPRYDAVELGEGIQLLRSEDAGASWSVALATSTYICIGNVESIGGGSFLVSVWDGVRDGPSILRSDDLGQTWHVATEELYYSIPIFNAWGDMRTIHCGAGTVFTSDSWFLSWTHRWFTPTSATGDNASLTAHLADTNNPHSVTYSQLPDHPTFGTMASETATDYAKYNTNGSFTGRIDFNSANPSDFIATPTIAGVDVLGDISTALTMIIGAP